MVHMKAIHEEEMDKFAKEIGVAQKGLTGVQAAVKVLKDYYSKQDDTDKSGTADCIIGLLEETESTLSKQLMDLKTDKQNLDRNFQEFMQENKIDLTQTDSEQDFKTKDTKKVSKVKSDKETDLSTEKEQLEAVAMYYAK